MKRFSFFFLGADFLHKFVIKICFVVGKCTFGRKAKERVSFKAKCGWESEHLCIIKNIFLGVIDCGKSVRKREATFVQGSFPIL